MQHSITTPQPPTSMTTQASSATITRLLWLDVLRGIAASAVVLTHALPLLAPGVPAPLPFDLGSFGVFLFFLCSGTIIPTSLIRLGSLPRFWIRRVFRLYPLYWLSVAGAVVCYALGKPSIAGLATIAERVLADPWATLLANVTMLQELFGYPHLINVYWTLTFELLFYVLISALFRLKLLQQIVLFALGLLLLALVFHWLAAVGYLELSNELGLRNVSYLAVLFAAAALAVPHEGPRRRMQQAVFGCLIIVVGVTCWQAPATGLGWTIALSLFLVCQRLPHQLFPAWLVYGGTISYGLYLLHPLVFALVPSIGGAVLTGGIWLGVLLLIAALAERWIERPGIAIGQRLTRINR